jgi:hypothetical protein
MDDERMRILRMLESGKITADEAVKLMDAISKDKEKVGLVDRIVKLFSIGESYTGKIREEFKSDNVQLSANASSISLKESSDSMFRVYGDGSLSIKEEKKRVMIGIFGVMTLDVPSNSLLNISLKAGDLNGILGVPLKLESKMSNTELFVKKPVNIDANIRMGNIILSFRKPVDMSFNVVNHSGSILENLGLNEFAEGLKGIIGKDEAKVVIDAKLSSIELKMREE